MQHPSMNMAQMMHMNPNPPNMKQMKHPVRNDVAQQMYYPPYGYPMVNTINKVLIRPLMYIQQFNGMHNPASMAPTARAFYPGTIPPTNPVSIAPRAAPSSKPIAVFKRPDGSVLDIKAQLAAEKPTVSAETSKPATPAEISKPSTPAVTEAAEPKELHNLKKSESMSTEKGKLSAVTNTESNAEDELSPAIEVATPTSIANTVAKNPSPVKSDAAPVRKSAAIQITRPDTGGPIDIPERIDSTLNSTSGSAAGSPQRSRSEARSQSRNREVKASALQSQLAQVAASTEAKQASDPADDLTAAINKIKIRDESPAAKSEKDVSKPAESSKEATPAASTEAPAKISEDDEVRGRGQVNKEPSSTSKSPMSVNSNGSRKESFREKVKPPRLSSVSRNRPSLPAGEDGVPLTAVPAGNKRVYKREFILAFIDNLKGERPHDFPDVDFIFGNNDQNKRSGTAGRLPNRKFDAASIPSGIRFPTNKSASLSKTNSMNFGPHSGVTAMNRTSSSGSLQGRGSRNQSNKSNHNLTIAPEDIKPLEVSENRWKPATVEKIHLSPEELLIKTVRSLLNKLTLDMFEPISTELIQSGINSDSTLSSVIQLIFDKATDEPNFAGMYAALCEKMSRELPNYLKPDETDEKATTAFSFRRIILNTCQANFEKGAKWNMSNEDLLKEEGKECTPENLADADYKRLKTKRRALGNITLIGELYRIGMLSQRIMWRCLASMTQEDKAPDEEEVESVCKMLTTIGKKLEQESESEKSLETPLGSVFTTLEKFSVNKTLSSRVRFMIRDVIDLRKDKWVPKRSALGPKTIEEIHREVRVQHCVLV